MGVEIFGTGPDRDALGHARNGIFHKSFVDATDGTYPGGRYDAYGIRDMSTMRAQQAGGKLFGVSLEPEFATNGLSGIEGCSLYVDVTLSENAQLDTHSMIFIDMASAKPNVVVKELYGLYIQPMISGSQKNIAIKTVEFANNGYYPAQHELGGPIKLHAHMNGGRSFEIVDLTSGQGVSFSNGSCMNFDPATNGLGQGIINHLGYNYGITQPRDLYIRNGMGDDIAKFQALGLSLRVVGGFACNGKSPAIAQTWDGTLSGLADICRTFGFVQ